MQTVAKVKAILFDVYGTLLNPLSIEAQVSQFVPELGLQFVTLWRAKQLEYSWLLSLMNRYESFWQVTQRALTYTCHRFNVSLTPAQYQQLLDCWTHVAPFDDVMAGLAILQAKNIRLGVLSNGNPTMLEAGLTNAGLRPYLDPLLSVEAARIFKPSPRVYDLALQHFGPDPAHIGFVSSNSWDAIGATAFGFQVCWLNRANNVLDELGFVPAYQVTNFTQMVEVYAKSED